MKVYAMEVEPEYRESPFWMDFDEHDNGTIYDGLTILSYDRWQHQIIKHTKLFDRIADNAEELAESIDDFEKRRECYYYPYCRNITEVFTEVLKPTKKLTTKQVGTLKKDFVKIYEAYGYVDVIDEIAEVMTILTSEKYDTANLYGYCQGDIVHVIYKVKEWNKEALAELETEYWNGGHGYEISTSDDPDDVVYCYYTEWDDEKRTAEIAAEFGVEPKDVIYGDPYDFREVEA